MNKVDPDCEDNFKQPKYEVDCDVFASHSDGSSKNFLGKVKKKLFQRGFERLNYLLTLDQNE